MVVKRVLARMVWLALGSAVAPLVLSACGSPAPGVALRGLRVWDTVQLNHIACPARGKCVAVGVRERDGWGQAVVVQQTGGGWSAPIALSSRVAGSVGADDTDIACASAGTCVVDGWSGNEGWSQGGRAVTHLFAEYRGHWSAHLVAIPDSFELTGHMPACSPNGSCSSVVGRIARGAPSTIWTYVIGVDNGRWAKPYRVGGKTLSIDGLPASWVIGYLVSCTASSCTTVSTTGSKRAKGLVLAQSEAAGIWGPVVIMPTTHWKSPASTFVVGIPAGPQSLSCVTPGDCLIAGTEGANDLGSVAEVRDGTWRTPTANVGVVAPYVFATVEAIACNTPAICVAAGGTSLASGKETLPFAQLRVDGRWFAPRLLTRLPAIGANEGVQITGAACPTTSTCDVVGTFDEGRASQGFLASYRDSQWRYSKVTFNGVRNGVWLGGLSCAGVCWVPGAILNSSGTPTQGFVFPFNSVRLHQG